ncbi:MAG: PD40 domain-containing protein [bacterium]|nr:PD40 domain-containing protein [bacterium]
MKVKLTHLLTQFAIIGMSVAGPSAQTDDAINQLTEKEILRVQGVENAYARWSADGRTILFQSNRAGHWQLFVMNADGSNQRCITPDSTNSNFPDWSTEHQLIAFVSDRNGNEEIYVMRLDGSGVKRLTNDAGRDIHPYLSPDGRTILFNSNRDNPNSFDIYQIGVDGTELRRLTETADVETCARFSPDGATILFLNGDMAAMNDEVYIMKPDGSARQNLTKSPAAEGWPTWSANGRQIIFSSDRNGRFSLFSMNADGSHPVQISSPPTPHIDARASVTQDGKQIVFNRQKGDGTISILSAPLPD